MVFGTKVVIREMEKSFMRHLRLAWFSCGRPLLMVCFFFFFLFLIIVFCFFFLIYLWNFSFWIPLWNWILLNTFLDTSYLDLVETSSKCRVSKSVIQWENEKWDTRIQRKARIRGPTPLQVESAKTESKPALYKPAMNEGINGELNYNSYGHQGQRTKWSLTTE